jgi:hypothetical protein
VSLRIRATDAFVDESIRGRRYLTACVLVEARNLSAVRRPAQALVLSGRRLHFHNESAQRRRELLSAFAHMPVSAFVIVCSRRPGTSEFEARDRCLAAIVERLQAERVARLVIETRHDDRDDHRTINRVRAPRPELVYEHRLAIWRVARRSNVSILRSRAGSMRSRARTRVTGEEFDDRSVSRCHDFDRFGRDALADADVAYRHLPVARAAPPPPGVRGRETRTSQYRVARYAKNGASRMHLARLWARSSSRGRDRLCHSMGTPGGDRCTFWLGSTVVVEG